MFKGRIPKTFFHCLIRLSAVCLFFSNSAQSQPVYLQYNSVMKDLIPAIGGGYFLATTYDTAGFQGTRISRLDDAFGIVRENVLIVNANIYSMVQDTNGDLYYTGDCINQVPQLLFLKTDSMAEVIFSKCFFHSNYYSYGKKIIRHSSGNLYIMGGARDFVTSLDTPDVTLLMKLFPTGNVIWSKEILSSIISWGNSCSELIESSDGMLVVVGKESSVSGPRGYIMKIDTQGTGAWFNIITGGTFPFGSQFEEVINLPDGNLFTVGGYLDPGGNGSVVSATSYMIGTGDSYQNFEYRIAPISGGGWPFVYVTGQALPNGTIALTGSNSVNSHALILTDSTHIPQWCKVYNNNSLYFTKTFLEINLNNEFTIVSNKSTIDGLSLIRTDSLGNNLCLDSTVAFTYSPGTISTALPGPFPVGLSPVFTSVNYFSYDTLLFPGRWDTLCSVPLYMNENNSAMLFSISPNPSGDFIVIHSAKPLRSLAIYDLLGHRISVDFSIRNFSEEDSKLKIDVSRLNPGIYFVKALSGPYTVSSKFIRQE